MHKTARWITLLAVVALIAGCGGGDDDQGGGGGGGATSPPATPTATDSVSMEDIEFKPADITVKVGDTITWTNDESVPHDVRATRGASFASDTFGENGTYRYRPTTAGVIDYVCTLHPGMDGTITVTR